MKIKLLVLLYALLLPLTAEAQTDNGEERITDKAGLELNFAKTLWFNTGNAAGLAYSPLQRFNTVSFEYGRQNGDYCLKQEGKGLSNLAFDTQGALQTGKFQLWGHFAYNNSTVKDASYNTLLYNPLDERFLYNVADTVVSKWKRQSYLLEMRGALPVIGNKLYVGLHVIYTDRLAAKQVDPRAESYQYFITLKPSVVYVSGRQSIGLNLLYTNLLERSVPTLSNSSNPQKVYILKGLGNFVDEVVGSGGLKTMYYFSDSYGAGLQYALNKPGLQLLAEAGATLHKTRVRQSATQPQKMGSTQIIDLTANIRALFGSGNKATLSFLHRKTEGTEYTLVFNANTGLWEVRSQAVMNKYSTNSATLSYTKFFTSGNTYRWKGGAQIEWNNKSDKYLLPEASLKYDNITSEVEGAYNFAFRKSTLLVGATASYNKNLSGDYVYTGIHPTDAPVRNWFPHDIEILTSDWIKASVSAHWSIALPKRMNLAFNASFAYLATIGGTGYNRTYALGGVSLIF